VWCPSNGWTFVAPKTAWDEDLGELGRAARGGSVSLAILDRRSNEAPGRFRRNPLGGRSFATRRRCSLLTDLCGYARRSRGSTELAEVLVWRQNSWPRMSIHLRDTTLVPYRPRPIVSRKSRMSNNATPITTAHSSRRARFALARMVPAFLVNAQPVPLITQGTRANTQSSNCGTRGQQVKFCPLLCFDVTPALISGRMGGANR